MKKVITSLIIVFAFVTLQAQTPILLTNGNFSTGTTLTGSTPWTTISGWTISQNVGLSAAGNAAVTAASSGVISGALTLVGTNSTALGTNNLNQAAILVESDKIDVSSYAGSTTAFTYAFQIKVATATGSNAPWNVVVKVYDASNVEVLLAISQTKSQGSLKTTAAGTYVNASVVGTLLGAPSANVKYITIQVHLGQMLANTPTLDNFTLNAAGAAASTTLTQPASTALSYEIGNGPSAEQSFQVAGANLGSNNITVTPGANIELSTASGSGFASSAITLTPASGTVATTTLYARLIADKDLGSVGANATRQVNVAATGTTTKTIQFTGTVTGIAVSNPASTTITYAEGAGPSTEELINVSGQGLSGDILVTPGANIEISTTSGSGFASTPITITQAGGAVASTPIYARLIAGLTVGSYNDATTLVTASSTGFASVVKQFKGTVNGIAMSNPVSTALYYAQGLGPSAERAFNVSGSGLTADIDITPGANIEISLTSGSGFVITPIILTQIAGSVASTPIYARLIASLSPATYNDATTKVTTSSTGLTSKELQFVGTVDLGTGLANKNISNLKCIAAKGTINVIGVEVGKQIDIYNNVGQKAKSVTATNNTVITLSAKGIYFVKVDALVEKVILK